MKTLSTNIVRVTAIFGVLLFIFVGCAKSSKSVNQLADDSYTYVKGGAESKGKYGFTSDSTAPAVGMETVKTTSTANEVRGNGTISPIEPTAGFVPNVSEKLIYSGYLNVQTKEFEKTLEAAKNLTKELGGFIESSSTSGDTYYPEGSAKAVVRGRNASITYRVPQKSFDNFFAALGKLGNVVDSSMNVQNITSQFVDNEAHLKSLQIQQERLLELLKKADKVEDMISIEKSLADIRYQIESITSTLRNWQTQVDYSTISMNISEVSDYTQNVPAVRSFWQRLGDAIKESGISFVRGVQNFIIGIILVFPSLLFWGILILVAVLITRKYLLKSGRAKRANVTPPTSESKDEN